MSEVSKEILDVLKQMHATQQEQFEFIKKHYDRAEAIQDKAEKLQDRATGVAKIIFPAIGVCILILIALMFRMF